MSTMNRIIVEIQVEDVQKRRHPSKHYVYVIKVTWSDGTRHVVYRRYSRFFDFQMNLLEKFPIEGGTIDPNERIIPFLPGKILFGRSHIREVALKRQIQIDEYCTKLIKLPANISQDEDVLDFFDLEPDDLNPQEHEKKQKQKAEHITGPTLAEQYIVIADYMKADKWDLPLKAGMILEVVEKSDSGWWFVNVDDKQGWVPSSYLERKDGLKENTAIRTNLGEDERYLCTENYSPQNTDEVALEKGTVVDVLEKNLDGWWFVRANGVEGIAPSTYLVKTEKSHMERVARASGVQIVSRLSDVSDIMRENLKADSTSNSRSNVQHILKKQRSLERGGSLRPPPRLNSVQKASSDVINSLRKENDHYVTIAEFQDNVGDGISFSSGQVVEVLQKSDSGWWFVKINGQEGWAPTTYIQKNYGNYIEEEDNVYNDIGDIDDDYEDAEDNKEDGDVEDDQDSEDPNDDEDYEVPDTSQDDVYEVPESIQNCDDWEDNNNDSVTQKQDKKHVDKGAVKRPVSKPPPPPPGGMKPEAVKSPPPPGGMKPEAVKSPPPPGGMKPEAVKSPASPCAPPKKLSQKPSLPPKENTGVGGNNLHVLLKAKISVPKPPPKSQKPVEKENNGSKSSTDNSPESIVKSTPSIAELKTKFSKQSENKGNGPSSQAVKNKGDNLTRPVQTMYKYTDVIPKDQRISSVGVLKAKFGNRNDSHGDSSSDNFSPVTSPKSDTGSKGFILPLKGLKPVSPPKSLKKVNSNVITTSDECIPSNSMGDLKAKFENRQSEVSQKPPLKSKPVTNLKRDSSVSSESDCSSVDIKPSAKASALKAMFEQQKEKQKFEPKTSLQSNESKTSNIAAKLCSKFEGSKPSLPKPPMHQTSASPPIPSKKGLTAVQTKSNLGQSKVPPSLPHKPLKSTTSKSPVLPIKSDVNKSKPEKLTPPTHLNFDKNHNNMDSKHTGTNALANIHGKLNPKSGSQDSSEPPTPPQKDYGPTSLSRAQYHYRTVCDFISENNGELGFCEGEYVEVLEHGDDWCLIRLHGKEGWAPASYIEPCNSEISDDVFHKQYRAISDFVTESEGEVGLCVGDVIDVIEETDSGWWRVKSGSSVGWAPSSYLELV